MTVASVGFVDNAHPRCHTFDMWILYLMTATCKSFVYKTKKSFIRQKSFN